MEEKIWNRDFAISICDQATLYVVKIELDQKIGGQCVRSMRSIESKDQKHLLWGAQIQLEKTGKKFFQREPVITANVHAIHSIFSVFD